jgi:hypothetical protein
VCVETPQHLFPVAKSVGADARVEIAGKFEKEWVASKSELGVEQYIVLE